MQVEVTKCNICREIIYEPDGHGMVGIPGLDSQVWTTGDGDVDVCSTCLSILQIAAGLGMIEIEMAQFYERAGWVFEDGEWTLPPVVFAHNDLIKFKDSAVPCGESP